MPLYRLLAGKHSQGRREGQRFFAPGDIIESDRDLTVLFGKEKFQRVEEGEPAKGTPNIRTAEMEIASVRDIKDDKALRNIELNEVDGGRFKTRALKEQERIKALHGGGTIDEHDIPESEGEEKETVESILEEEAPVRLETNSGSRQDENRKASVRAMAPSTPDELRKAAELGEKARARTESKSSGGGEEDSDDEEEHPLGMDVTEDYTEKDDKVNVYQKDKKFYVTKVGGEKPLKGTGEGLSRSELTSFLKDRRKGK